jgi:hypothetical protein
MRFSIISLVSLPLFLALTYAGGVEKDKRNNVCTVKANGKQKDDVPNLLKAFKECGNGGSSSLKFSPIGLGRDLILY